MFPGGQFQGLVDLFKGANDLKPSIDAAKKREESIKNSLLANDPVRFFIFLNNNVDPESLPKGEREQYIAFLESVRQREVSNTQEVGIFPIDPGKGIIQAQSEKVIGGVTDIQRRTAERNQRQGSVFAGFRGGQGRTRRAGEQVRGQSAPRTSSVFSRLGGDLPGQLG